MKKNKLVKISAIIAAALLISACSTNVREPQEKIAVINWEQAVSAHPQYAKLEQGEKILQDLLNKRIYGTEFGSLSLKRKPYFSLPHTMT